MTTGAAQQGNKHYGLSELIWTLQSAPPASSQRATPASTSSHWRRWTAQPQLAPCAGTLCPYTDLNLPPWSIRPGTILQDETNRGPRPAYNNITAWFHFGSCVHCLNPFSLISERKEKDRCASILKVEWICPNLKEPKVSKVKTSLKRCISLHKKKLNKLTDSEGLW